MAIQAMALGVQNPEINALGALAAGQQARQSFDMNNIAIAQKGLETIGSIALGSMGGKIDGQADPALFNEGLDYLAQNGVDVTQFRDRADLAPVIARSSMTALQQISTAQDDRSYQLALDNFELEVMKAAQGPAPTADMQNFTLAQSDPAFAAHLANKGGPSAAEAQITRIMETGVPRNIAVGIADGVLKSDRHPVTGELQVIDLSTGKPVYGGPQQQPAPPAQSQPDPSVTQQFGTQFPASNESFGLGGAAQGAINTVGDAIGVGAPYPDVQQTQADFGILRESLLNDIAESYGRQPPSWLLQEIRNLTPAAGSPLEGSGQAVSKLNALGRHLQNELKLTEESLQRQLTPTNRQELEARHAGLQAGLARVTGAIKSFDGQQPQEDLPPPPEGVSPDQWQVLTPEERALWK